MSLPREVPSFSFSFQPLPEFFRQLHRVQLPTWMNQMTVRTRPRRRTTTYASNPIAEPNIFTCCRAKNQIGREPFGANLIPIYHCHPCLDTLHLDTIISGKGRSQVQTCMEMYLFSDIAVLVAFLFVLLFSSKEAKAAERALLLHLFLLLILLRGRGFVSNLTLIGYICKALVLVLLNTFVLHKQALKALIYKPFHQTHDLVW